MAEYIDREAVMSLMFEIADGYKYIETDVEHLIERLWAIPVADVVEVRHGRWIDKNNEGSWNYCSVCGQQVIDLYDLCPSCGAVMDGGQDDV